LFLEKLGKHLSPVIAAAMQQPAASSNAVFGACCQPSPLFVFIYVYTYLVYMHIYLVVFREAWQTLVAGHRRSVAATADSCNNYVY